VGRFRLTRRAEADLHNKAGYTLRSWGEVQTERYLSQLEDCVQLLAGNPALGRMCDEIRPGLRRMEHAKHVVFYREERGGILVSRILHQRMLSGDNYFSLPTTTILTHQRQLQPLQSSIDSLHWVDRTEDRALQGCTPSADSGAKTRKGRLGRPFGSCSMFRG
jgi:toxin ParE1/3/4